MLIVSDRIGLDWIGLPSHRISCAKRTRQRLLGWIGWRRGDLLLGLIHHRRARSSSSDGDILDGLAWPMLGWRNARTTAVVAHRGLIMSNPQDRGNGEANERERGELDWMMSLPRRWRCERSRSACVHWIVVLVRDGGALLLLISCDRSIDCRSIVIDSR